MNKVVLIGRLTKDPELKFTPNKGTPIATFTLAIDRRVSSKDGEKQADFIPVIVFGKIAETVANYITKGRMLGVSGRIQTRSYDAKDGTKRYVTEVVSDEVQFLDSGKKNESNEFKASGTYDESVFGGSDMAPVDDNDIPF